VTAAVDEGAWSASLERELWQLRIRTTDWRRLNATVIDAPTLHRAPVVVRAGPRLLTAGRRGRWARMWPDRMIILSQA
jgi:hypothetical protein